MRQASIQARAAGKTIGLVPTMGYLHEGHLSLLRLARRQSDILVCSIFVNPTQFGPNEDLDRYPRDYQHDEQLCAQEKVDWIFYPTADDMYPAGFKTYVQTEGLDSKLCGVSRPGHFRGVTTIVAKLFNLVQPQVAVFGQKDAQQFIILQKMVNDLNFDIEMIRGPIVREADGLAMSSRNKYLSPAQRKQAVVLHGALEKAAELIKRGEKSSKTIIQAMKKLIATADQARIDYVNIVDPDSLESVETVSDKYLIALAVYFGQTRLIDNILEI